MKYSAIIPAILLALSVHPHAESADMAMDSMEVSSSEAQGTVRKVDQADGIVTISHEPVKSLGWSAMTMDFAVRDKTLLGKLAPGKNVRFTFIQKRGGYLITKVK